MRTIPTPTPAAAPEPTRAAVPQPPLPALAWGARAIMDDPAAATVLHSAWSGDPAVVVPSPPGAGKTRLVALLAATLADRADLRVGITAQTRDQATELARRLGGLTNRAGLIWSTQAARPDLPAGSAPVPSRTVVPVPALPFPEPSLATERLLLRTWRAEDAAALFEAFHDAEVLRFS